MDFTCLSEQPPNNSSITDLRSVAKSRATDDSSLNMSTLVSGVPCKHMDFFSVSFDDLVRHHIEHRFYELMSQKLPVT